MAKSIERIRREIPLAQALKNEWLAKPLTSTWAGWLADRDSEPKIDGFSIGYKLLSIIISGPEHTYNLLSLQYSNGKPIFSNLLHPENLVPDTCNFVTFHDDTAYLVPEEMDHLMRRKLVYYNGATGYFEVSDLFVALVKDLKYKNPNKPTRSYI